MRVPFGVLSALALFASATVQATPILSISGQGASDARAAEAAFLSSLGSYTTETFETGFSPGAQRASLSTAVGDFSVQTFGVGGACDRASFRCNRGTAVLNSAITPFKGRFAVGDSSNWLDSMDAQVMTFSPLAGTTAVGFYLTDPNDAGGRMSIGGHNVRFDDLFGAALANGRLYYLTIVDKAGLGDIVFFSNDRDDGYGLDNVTVANVPEPGTLGLVACGIVVMLVLRRRVAASG